MNDRSLRVGLFLRGGSYAYQDEVVIGAHQQCTAQRVDLTCLSGGNVTLRDPRNFIYALPDRADLDAVIFVKGTMGASDGDATVAALAERLRPLPICMIGSPEPRIPCIAIDNSSGVRALTGHLIDKHDCRRLAFVTGHGREAEHRLAGYRAAHRDRGLSPDDQLIIRGDFRFSAGQDAVAQLFPAGERRCDAIVAANDWMALGALEALTSRGLRVPEDVAVVGFDDVEEARFATPPLTTVRQAPRQLGVEAVRLVLALVRGEPGADVVLETVPQIRQSCGCFRGTRRGEPDLPGSSDRTTDAPDYAGWARATAARGPAPDPALPADWAKRMVDAIRQDLDGNSHDNFVAAVDDVVGGAADLGNVSAWHQPVATLRREVIRHLDGSPELALMESIFERTHILIGDHAERTQGRRRLETEEASRALEELGADVRTSLDHPSIGRALAAHLPGLRVRSCSVVVHKPGRDPTGDDEARLIIAWDQEHGLSEIDPGVVFRAGHLQPATFRPARRHTFVVQPLCFQTEALGWCLLEMDPPRAAVCEAIPAQISAALKATSLREQLILEATKRERAERSRLAHEIELAARIQTGILPKNRVIAGLAISTSMVPATEVGGDYFDILPFPGGCWLGIGDVAGHGLHAGLVMMMLQSAVSAITHDRPHASPAEVWAAVNAVLCDNVRSRLGRDEHATLTLIRYGEDGRCVYAGAHEEIAIHRAGSRRVERLPTVGVWAGIERDYPPGTTADREFLLEPGDTILLHTDGVTEARNSAREMFGLNRLYRLLERTVDGGVDAIRDEILSEVRAFTSAQADDMTVVVLRYR